MMMMGSCSSTPHSFFRVMLGNFQDIMFIPPKFGRTINDLIGEIVYLEDSEGNSSEVKICTINGSLAFQQGWREFVLDHSIETGEFLVFQHISRSLFSVKIYSISACERVHFHGKDESDNAIKKRKMIGSLENKLHLPKQIGNSEDMEGGCFLAAENPGIKEVEVKFVPSESTNGEIVVTNSVKFMEIETARQISPPSCPEAREVDEDSECKRELYLFESLTLKNERSTDDKEKISADGNNCGRSKTAAEAECSKLGSNFTIPGHFQEPKREDENLTQQESRHEKLIDDHNDQEMVDSKRQCLTDIPDEKHSMILPEEKVKKSDATEEWVCHNVDEDLADELEDVKAINVDMFLDEKDDDICCNRSTAMPEEKTLHCEKFGITTKPEVPSKKEDPIPVVSAGNLQQGTSGVDVKQEDACEPANIPNVFPKEEMSICLATDENCGPVKTEDLDFDESPLPKSIKFSFSLSSTAQNWLELSERLPTQWGRKRLERKVIILEDPSMRLWPVLYQESDMFQGFSSGWGAFARANNLQEGDLCELVEVANESGQVCHVQISKVLRLA
ncbi:B3 domain-containing protein Os02g0598200-like isoform X2 [Ananas comosus]|uniref:B3 domain-containing protein Os02g0598200-like isoform X2 n=1 Tax=Ananas comosus TaxID=4615 RepID=A0A6P5GU35_ANACO|nr:B3 domain-containing protein Os02g0598200-like isoform X2 [Ananas comosus]